MDTNQVRICVPVCAGSVRDLDDAIARADEVGDVIELRLDYLKPSELDQGISFARTSIEKLTKPIVVTFRPAEQGGARALDHFSRMLFWLFNKPRGAAFYDMEFDIALDLGSSDVAPHLLNLSWETVICSHHDFVGVPADLEQIYERMMKTPARILKIAVRADDVTDCIPLFRLLERARLKGRAMIAIAMGTSGIMTRILGPSRGAFLTYGALETESATAPGQPTAKELRELYRIDQINRETQIMGLVGLPVAHSVSPHMLNAAFAESKVNAVYIPFEVRDAGTFMRRMVHPRTREIDWNLRGLSVTAPHKTAVVDYLDWIEPAAKEIGAVNTIVAESDALIGYNTDAIAVLKPVIEKLGTLRDVNCAVIGAGGAASATLWSLKKEGAKATLFARNEEKGTALAEKFGASCIRLEGACFEECDVVINATPLGTHGPFEGQTPVTAVQLRGARLAYDLVYNPSETRFLREAGEAGCETVGGLTMLVLQAAEQFRLWTGAAAPEKIMAEAAGRALRV